MLGNVSDVRGVRDVSVLIPPTPPPRDPGFESTPSQVSVVVLGGVSCVREGLKTNVKV